MNLLKRAAIALILCALGSSSATGLFLVLLLALGTGSLGSDWWLVETIAFPCAGVPVGLILFIGSLTWTNEPADHWQPPTELVNQVRPELATVAPDAFLAVSREQARAVRQRQIWLAIADGLNAACDELDEQDRRGAREDQHLAIGETNDR